VSCGGANTGERSAYVASLYRTPRNGLICATAGPFDLHRPREIMGNGGNKPGSVSPAPCGTGGGGHSSGAGVSDGLEQPTRESAANGGIEEITLIPYLALLPAGFGKPARHRAAGGLLPHHFTLTPHPPCRRHRVVPGFDGQERASGRYLFCSTFPRLTPGGYYPSPRSLEPGLSSRATCASGHLASNAQLSMIVSLQSNPPRRERQDRAPLTQPCFVDMKGHNPSAAPWLSRGHPVVISWSY